MYFRARKNAKNAVKRTSSHRLKNAGLACMCMSNLLLMIVRHPQRLGNHKGLAPSHGLCQHSCTDLLLSLHTRFHCLQCLHWHITATMHGRCTVAPHCDCTVPQLLQQSQMDCNHNNLQLIPTYDSIAQEKFWVLKSVCVLQIANKIQAAHSHLKITQNYGITKSLHWKYKCEQKEIMHKCDHLNWLS